MYLYKIFSTAAISLSLLACGGGGGSPGAINGMGSTVPVSSAADISIILDKSTILSSANETATLTVTVVDINRNVLPGVGVSVTVDSGGIFTPTDTSGKLVTSSSGTFGGVVSIGSDKTSRTINVTVTAGNISKSVILSVNGSGDLKPDYIFELDKTIISNSGSDKILLTVTALDSSRNVIPGIPVTVSVDGDGVFSRTGSALTDANGKFIGSISIGSNKTDRTINITIIVGGVVKVASVVVSGSSISATAIPSTPIPGQLVSLNISASDKSGIAIPNTLFNLSGNAGLSGTVTSNSSGNAIKVFNAPSIPGTYYVSVSGSGVNASPVLIQVVDSSGNGISPAVGAVSAATIAAVPSQVAANLSGSTANRSKVTARFLTASNSGIKNMRVRFVIDPPGLGGGESISTSSATIYTDDSGTATADYIPGTRTSPTNGVIVRACYSPVDFVSNSDCPNFKLVNLTVSGTPFSISIGSDNTINKGLGGIAYVKKYLIQVNDSAGVAVKDAVVAVSVDITHYGKATAWNPPGFAVPTLDLLNPGNNTSVVSSVLSPGQTADTVVPTGEIPPIQVLCANEDKSRNGLLDTGEDKNGDGILEPRKADITVSYVDGNKTDINGQLLVQASWGQNVGGWLYFTLRATVGVEGSEGDVSKPFLTTVADDDIKNGSFLTPPYGTGSCSQPY